MGITHKVQRTKNKIQGASRFEPGILFFVCILFSVFCFFPAAAQDVKEPNVAGAFYPKNPRTLSDMVDSLLNQAPSFDPGGHVTMIIAPHAGYTYSGKTAAAAYKTVRGGAYKTVVVISPSHYFPFNGASVYESGNFRTPLGDIPVDSDFAGRLIRSSPEISFRPQVFEQEHALEVHLPFLQRVLSDFKVVPVIIGDLTFEKAQELASNLYGIIGDRLDVLVVVSTDLYHGHDYTEGPVYDREKLAFVEALDAEGLYRSLRDEGSPRMCGGFAVVCGVLLARQANQTIKVLEHTNSAEVTGVKAKGAWTVGYAALVGIQSKPKDTKDRNEETMLNSAQRDTLLTLARSSIQTYLKTGKKLQANETDPVLNEQMGAFVTLHDRAGGLRGCIGHMIGDQPLYLTVRDMAVESAVHDPRFPAVTLEELAALKIEISVLSPLKRVSSAAEIEMGKHGVMVRRGLRSGVYLPQVATDTGWSKEQFLSSLCAQKAGLEPDAWSDSKTELYVFSAEVFSEAHD